MEAEQKTSGREASASAESAGPNPEAIAWYVEEAQRLLEDQQRTAESLRTRGGQVAGFGAAVLALIGGNSTVLLAAVHGGLRLVVGIALLASALSLGVAVAVAIWGALRPGANAAVSAYETSHYTSERFLAEQELWRIHIRSLHSLNFAITVAQQVCRSAATAVEWSLRALLAGLGLSLLAIAILIVEVT